MHLLNLTYFSLDSEARPIEFTLPGGETKAIVTTSEAEKHLNFNPKPDLKTQRKIDYFITPYNDVKVVTKYMSFNERENLFSSDISSKDKWKKISTMILNQDKHSLRDTLSNINDKLYKKVDQALKDKKDKILGGRNKRVKFAASKIPCPSRKFLSTSNLNTIANQFAVHKRHSIPMNIPPEGPKGPQKTPRSRSSLISQVIDDLRNNQKSQAQRQQQENEEVK